MENATKALLIAGSLLISIVVISMLGLMINSLTSYQNLSNSSSETDILTAFNSQFEAYNRNDVRGSDLYTLANKVIDYNRRKTASIAKDVDIGNTIGYVPIELTIDLKGHANVFAYDNKDVLFTNGKYRTYETENTNADNLANITKTIQNLENDFPKDSLNALTTNISGIYLEEYKNDYAKANVNDSIMIKDMLSSINTVNNCFGVDIFNINENTSGRKSIIEEAWDWIWGGNTHAHRILATGKVITNLKSSVYKYYEFVQFKRGRFECKSIGKDANTGRVTSMYFEFTGKLN